MLACLWSVCCSVAHSAHLSSELHPCTAPGQRYEEGRVDSSDLDEVLLSREVLKGWSKEVVISMFQRLPSLLGFIEQRTWTVLDDESVPKSDIERDAMIQAIINNFQLLNNLGKCSSMNPYLGERSKYNYKVDCAIVRTSPASLFFNDNTIIPRPFCIVDIHSFFLTPHPCLLTVPTESSEYMTVSLSVFIALIRNDYRDVWKAYWDSKFLGLELAQKYVAFV